MAPKNQLNNKTCAYRDCENLSVRMEFPMGFSALFCNDCAAMLQKEGIAMVAKRNNHTNKDTENRIDGNSTPTPIHSIPNSKVSGNG